MSNREALKIVHISFAGPTRQIMVDGVVHQFEMHHYCGPIRINKKGDPIKQWGPRHKVWTALTYWAQQGERVGDNGLCVWDYPAEDIVEHVGGKHYRCIGHTLPRKGS